MGDIVTDMINIKEQRRLIIEVIFFLIILLVLFLLIAYYKDHKEYQVRFITYTDEVIASQMVKEKDKVKIPKEIKKEGYEFKGWYLNGKRYEFTTPVTADLTLEARWEKKVEE